MSYEFSAVAKSIPRVDAAEKVTGKAKYTADFKIPGLCYSKLLGSPFPHAKILRIDTSMADNLPGVVTVLTGEDPGNKLYGGTYMDQYLIARDVVRYVGEPVAAVVAESEDIAIDALDLIDVDYEELPAVFDMEEAIKPDCPVVIHPDLLQYTRISGYLDSWDPCPNNRRNVFQHWHAHNGDVEKAFKEADLIVENRFSTPRANAAPIETHVVDAWLEPDGGVTLRGKKQCLHSAVATISEVFGIRPSKVRFIVPYVGGGFGCSWTCFPEVIAALMAIRSRRPVRLSFDRTEQFTMTPHKPSRITYIKDGVKEDGTIIAREIRSISEYGAYAGPYDTWFFVSAAMAGAVALYRIPNLRLEAYGVYVNLIPCSAFRGIGNPELQWAIEQQMDIIAHRVGIDSVELRRKHILKEGERQSLGQITHSIGATKCLDKVAEFTGWGKPSEPLSEGPWRRGKGVSLIPHSTPTDMPSFAIVKVHMDGTVEVRHSAIELGQGCDTLLSQIAAEEFGIPVEQIKIIARDTAVTPYDAMTAADRITFYAGNAVLRACQDAKRQLLTAAEPILGRSSDSLEIRSGKVYVKGMDDVASISISDLFSPLGFAPLSGGEIVGKGEFCDYGIPSNTETGQSEKTKAFCAYGSCGVQVAVNAETGEIRVEKICGAFDMGRPINPKMCEQQIEGGIGQGIGHAIYEETILTEGLVINPSFVDYHLPTIMEIPSGKNVGTLISAAAHKLGPYGAKGFGEAVFAPLLAAIGNAFYNATGVRIKNMPLTRKAVFEALREEPNSRDRA